MTIDVQVISLGSVPRRTNREADRTAEGMRVSIGVISDKVPQIAVLGGGGFLECKLHHRVGPTSRQGVQAFVHWLRATPGTHEPPGISGLTSTALH